MFDSKTQPYGGGGVHPNDCPEQQVQQQQQQPVWTPKNNTVGMTKKLYKIRYHFFVVCMMSLFHLIFFISYGAFSVTAVMKEVRRELSADGNHVVANDYDDVPYAIFYHAYINPTNVYHSLGIVVEQMAQWQASRHANATLYYTHLGDTTTPFPCPQHGHCELLNKGSTGWEAATLIKISEYCQEHPDHNVMYLHSKGSFHPLDENNRLRKVLTRSAFSDECHEGLTNTKCNICSARFSPLPHWHTPGNMWTAKCSYIAMLYPIMEFEPKVKEIVDEYFQLPSNNNEPPHRPPPNWSVGTNRFAHEHWVHTHPQVNPCDVYPDVEWVYGYWMLDVELPLDLYHHAPRNLTITTKTHFVHPRPRPHIRLEYRLFELQQLYNETPADDSFVWTWYQQNNLL